MVPFFKIVSLYLSLFAQKVTFNSRRVCLRLCFCFCWRCFRKGQLPHYYRSETHPNKLHAKCSVWFPLLWPGRILNNNNKTYEWGSRWYGPAPKNVASPSVGAWSRAVLVKSCPAPRRRWTESVSCVIVEPLDDPRLFATSGRSLRQALLLRTDWHHGTSIKSQNNEKLGRTNRSHDS
jgi:hypothetical protein